MTEIGVEMNAVQNIVIKGYNLISYYCRPTKRCGGVGIWIKDCIRAKPIDVNLYCIEQHAEMCAIRFSKDKSIYVLVNCYRSPSGDEKLFFNNLNALLEDLYNTNVNFIITGDFNFDAYASPHFRYLCNVLSGFNCKHVVRWPTRVTQTSCTIIDQIFYNFQNDGICCVFDNVIADHRSVFMELPVIFSPEKENECMPIFKRIFSVQNIENFIVNLNDEDWSDLYSLHNFDEAFGYFYDVLLYSFEVNFPKQIYYAKKNNKNWIDKNIIQSSQSLRNLFILKNTYTSLIPIYAEAKKRHISLVKNVKRNYYQRQVGNGRNSRDLWRVVTELSDKQKNKSTKYSIDLDGEVVVDDVSLIATEFNKFFVGAPNELVNNIGPINDNVTLNITESYNQFSLGLLPFSENELLSLLSNKLKSKQSAGSDEIPLVILKRSLSAIVEPLTYLVNMSFEMGSFPKRLLNNKVIPVYKSKDYQLMENYRPVTVPESLSKIFEYAYLDRLLGYLGKFEIITNQQHGFRCNRSTSSAILAFYNKIIEYVEAGECPVGMFCDMSRAFDCVNHCKLLCTLENYGIRGVSLSWISSFLKNRQQFVSLNSGGKTGVSERLPIVMGVPQGSVLGPVLFILYINDLSQVINTTDHVIYADDISLIVSDQNDTTLQMNCSNTLLNTISYLNLRDLYFNTEKTQIVRFHNSQKQINEITFQVKNEHLSNKGTPVKFLGLYMDDTMNFHTHCQRLTSRLCSFKYVFRNLCDVLDNNQIISVYYAQIESRIRYGICLWGSVASAKTVFLAQKQIVRIIAKCNKTHSCRSLFKKFNILTLVSIFIYEVSVYIFKNRNKYIQNKCVHNFNTRQKEQYHIPFARCNVVSNSADIVGLKIMNKLPQDVKAVDSFNLFKNRLRQFLLQKCFYTLEEYFQDS